MLNQFSIYTSLIVALEQMPDYAKFMKDMMRKKRSLSIEDDARMHNCVLLLQGLLCKKGKILDVSPFHV